MWFKLSFVCVLFVYAILKWHYAFWKKRGISGPVPVMFFGNIKECFFGKKAMWEVFSKIYRTYEQHQFVGIFRVMTPCLLIRDPVVIRNIETTSFKSFSNNGFYIDENNDSILAQNAFFLRGLEWKRTRNLFVRGFTNEMLKSAFHVFDDNGKEMVAFLENDNMEMDAKDLIGNYTAHNVAVWAFGLSANDTRKRSEFRKLAREFLNSEDIPGVVQLFAVTAPSILKLFRIKLVPEHVEYKLCDLMEQSEKYRTELGIRKSDFFQYLINHKNSNKLSEAEVTAFAASFLIDGYETSSLILSFILFELAKHQQIQEKLRNEIKEKSINGQLSFECIQKMTYLDACINESLRKHAVLAFNVKECTREYTFDLETGKILTVRPGQLVIFPIDAIQNDPKYFHQPERFNPDRMLYSNAKNSAAYIPFGVGPRACLGKQYGLIQLKVGVAHLVLNFKIQLGKKMELPLKYDPKLFLKYPKGGIWLNFSSL